MHLASSKSLLYAVFWKKYAQRSSFVSIFVASEIFETFFHQKRPNRYYFFINIYKFFIEIGLLYWLDF